MTPRQVDELTGDEYRLFWDYFERDMADQERQARKARRSRG